MSHRIVRGYVEVQVQVHVQVHEYPQYQVCPAVSRKAGIRTRLIIERRRCGTEI